MKCYIFLKEMWSLSQDLLDFSKISDNICLTVKTHLQWSQMGWLSLDRRYEWVTRLWPILRRVKTVSSRRHNDVRGLFLPSTGLIENSLVVGMLSHESCHSFMHSLDICGKKLSGEILPWVMTAQIPPTLKSLLSDPTNVGCLGVSELPLVNSWRLHLCRHPRHIIVDWQTWRSPKSLLETWPRVKRHLFSTYESRRSTQLHENPVFE